MTETLRQRGIFPYTQLMDGTFVYNAEQVQAALEAQAAQIAKQTTVIEGYERIYNDAMRALRETIAERDAQAAQIAERDAQIEALRDEYDRACKLVADMHAAAMGAAVGPTLGVAEDVAALKASHDRYRQALNTIAAHLSSDWPERCQKNVRVARAALADTIDAAAKGQG